MESKRIEASGNSGRFEFSKTSDWTRRIRHDRFWVFMLALFVFAYAVIFSVFSNFAIHNKYGDAQSLMNVYVYGEARSRELNDTLMPQVPQISNGVCCEMKPYSGFPPVMNWLGRVFDLAGFDLAAYRILLAAFFGLSMIAFASAVRHFYGTDVAALTLVSALFLAPTWRTGVTQVYNLGDLILWLSFWLLIAKRANFRNMLIFTFCVMFLLASVTYEYVLFAFLLFGAAFLTRGLPKTVAMGISAGLGAVAAVISKVFIDALDRGNISEAFQVQLERFIFRVSKINSEIIEGMSAYPEFLWISFDRHFVSPIIVFALLVSTNLLMSDRRALRHCKLLIWLGLPVLFLASFSWSFVFVQHTVIHVNSIVNRHWIYPVAMLGGLAAAAVWRMFRTRLAGGEISKKYYGLVGVHVIFFVLFVFQTGKDFSAFARTGKELTWTNEVRQIRSICAESAETVCLLPDKNLLRAAFLHQNGQFALGARKFRVE